MLMTACALARVRADGLSRSARCRAARVCGKQGTRVQESRHHRQHAVRQRFLVAGHQRQDCARSPISRASAVVLFFGYTHCPDVCPTTMAELSQALAATRPTDAQARAGAVRHRRSRARHRRSCWRSMCRPSIASFVGLRPADRCATHEGDQGLPRVLREGAGQDARTSYTMDHTAASYVFDPARQAAAICPRRAGRSAPWVHDMKLLLD